MNIVDIKEAYNGFKVDMDKWTLENSLSKLRDYKEYRDPHIWGQGYRNDQDYFETISHFKNVVFGVISLTESIKDKADRIIRTQAENFIKLLEVELKKLDNLLFTARERLRFYENIMRVIGNVTWGSY